jgi:hypothetical protein
MLSLHEVHKAKDNGDHACPTVPFITGTVLQDCTKFGEKVIVTSCTDVHHIAVPEALG